MTRYREKFRRDFQRRIQKMAVEIHCLLYAFTSETARRLNRSFMAQEIERLELMEIVLWIFRANLKFQFKIVQGVKWTMDERNGEIEAQSDFDPGEVHLWRRRG